VSSYVCPTKRQTRPSCSETFFLPSYFTFDHLSVNRVSFGTSFVFFQTRYRFLNPNRNLMRYVVFPSSLSNVNSPRSPENGFYSRHCDFLRRHTKRPRRAAHYLSLDGTRQTRVSYTHLHLYLYIYAQTIRQQLSRTRVECSSETCTRDYRKKKIENRFFFFRFEYVCSTFRCAIGTAITVIS